MLWLSLAECSERPCGLRDLFKCWWPETPAAAVPEIPTVVVPAQGGVAENQDPADAAEHQENHEHQQIAELAEALEHQEDQERQQVQEAEENIDQNQETDNTDETPQGMCSENLKFILKPFLAFPFSLAL